MGPINPLLWRMSAEQFSAFDLQLYLDTHPHDRNALIMRDRHMRNYMRAKREYEAAYGPISSDYPAHDSWHWVTGPWPWEMEAN